MPWTIEGQISGPAGDDGSGFIAYAGNPQVVGPPAGVVPKDGDFGIDGVTGKVYGPHDSAAATAVLQWPRFPAQR